MAPDCGEVGNAEIFWRNAVQSVDVLRSLAAIDVVIIQLNYAF